MILQALDLGEIRLVWYRYIQQLNEQAAIKLHERRCKDKNNLDILQNVAVKDKKIKLSVLDTGAHLIRLYVVLYSQILANPFLRNNYQGEEYPGLFCNSVTLAKERGCSDRTIRNHIEKLMDPAIGLITKKVFHGTRKDYEIYINPRFLFPHLQAEFLPWLEKRKKYEKAPAATPNGSFFPLNSVLEPSSNNLVTDISHVEKCGMSVLPAGENPPTTGTQFYWNPGPHPRHPEEAEPGLQGANELQGVELRTPGGRAAAAPVKAPQKLKEAHLQYIESFWLYAKALLYRGQEFTETQTREAKNAIYRGVYGRFSANWSEKKWDEYQKRLFIRVDLAARYLRENPDFFIPKPYAVAIKGKGYFDKENQTGFIRTHAWLLKHEQKAKELKAEAIIKTACRAIKKFYDRSLKENLLRQQPKSVNQDKNLLQIYQRYEQQLKPYGTGALERYATRCQVIIHRKIAQAWNQPMA
ncbi:MAG: hypothetical protein ACO1OF_16315 [Adhaeribacter sp.]